MWSKSCTEDENRQKELVDCNRICPIEKWLRKYRMQRRSITDRWYHPLNVLCSYEFKQCSYSQKSFQWKELQRLSQHMSLRHRSLDQLGLRGLCLSNRRIYLKNRHGMHKHPTGQHCSPYPYKQRYSTDHRQQSKLRHFYWSDHYRHTESGFSRCVDIRNIELISRSIHQYRAIRIQLFHHPPKICKLLKGLRR